MNKNIIVSPSILGLEDKAAFVNKALTKGITHIHYDIMDGHFVPATSIPEDELEFIFKNTNKHVKDVHLMVLDPLRWIKKFEKEADYFTFHYEAESIDRIRKIFKKYGHLNKIGLAIKPKTKVSEIIEFLPDVSHILVMSVEPGKGGQSFMESSVDKIIELREKLDKYNKKAFIQVDGGIKPETAKKVIKAGATNLVVGSYCQKNIDQKDFITSITG